MGRFFSEKVKNTCGNLGLSDSSLHFYWYKDEINTASEQS